MITSKSTEPLVSIIINCHNGEKYLRNAIDSVFSQTYGSWEIIFWDNWSSDNSAEIARSYGPVVKYFRSESFTSLYAARNYAIAKACGDYIAFLDCDDVWLCNKLEVQVAEVLKGSKIVYGGFETFSGPAPCIHAKIGQAGPSGRITNSLLRRNHISIGSVLICKEIFKKAKFDPSYNLLGDYEFWLRLSLNHEIQSVGNVVEYSRSHDTNLSDVKKADWSKERRRFYKNFVSIRNLIQYPNLLRYILITEIKAVFNKR